jgi:hypothetical protein
MIGGLPARAKVLAEDGTLDPMWIELLSDVVIFIQGMQTSGPTSKRPTKNLYPGRYYFDTSLGALGKPIWIGSNGTSWIDADGNIV